MIKEIKYKNTGLEWCPQVPVHWELKKVKYLIRDKDGIKIGPFGSSLKLDTLVADGIKVYGQGNVIQDDFILGHRHIDIDRFEKEFTQYEIIEGDVLLTMMGTTGKAKIFTKDFKRGIIDSHLIRLRLNKNKFNNYLFALVLESGNYIYNQIKEVSRGSIMEGLNSGIVKELLFLVPPLTEQQKIADYLDKRTSQIDSIIGRKEKQIELYKEERTAVINHAVTKGLNPDAKMKDSGIEWLGEIPEHWEVKKLKYVAKIKTGRTPKIQGSKVDYFENGEFDWFTPSDFKQSILSNANRKINKSAIDNLEVDTYTPMSIYLVSIGATVGKISYCENVGSCNQQINVISFDNRIHSKFGFYYLLAQKEQILSLVDYTTLPILNQAKSKEINFVFIKNISEQQQIVFYLDKETQRIDTLIEKTTKQIDLLKEYKEALINEVVTGQKIID